MSVGELEMTRNTSDVAVCCSNQSDELVRTLLLCLKKPCVLDRDYRLVGKGFNQLYLLLRERPNLSPLQEKNINGCPLGVAAGGAHHSPKVTSLCGSRVSVSPFRIGQNIRNLNRFARQQHSAGEGVASLRTMSRVLIYFIVLGECDRSLRPRSSLAPSPCWSDDYTPWPRIRDANSTSVLSTASKSNAGRLDDLESLQGSRLLLKDSASSRVRCCAASNRRTFSMAMTAWSAKVVDEFDLLVV